MDAEEWREARQSREPERTECVFPQKTYDILLRHIGQERMDDLGYVREPDPEPEPEPEPVKAEPAREFVPVF